jgi:hypothetical protein
VVCQGGDLRSGVCRGVVKQEWGTGSRLQSRGEERTRIRSVVGWEGCRKGKGDGTGRERGYQGYRGEGVTCNGKRLREREKGTEREKEGVTGGYGGVWSHEWVQGMVTGNGAGQGKETCTL